MMSKRPSSQVAFTLIELLVIIAIVAMLIVLVFSGVRRAKEEALRRQCVNNLKQVGLSFRQWSLSGDKMPMGYPAAQGGTAESIINGEMFRTFQVMSNELKSPKILACPADDRIAASEFVVSLTNTNISYFIGVDASDSRPQMFLAGDRNILGGSFLPGRILMVTGNDAVRWDKRMHQGQVTWRWLTEACKGSVLSGCEKRLSTLAW